MKLWDMMGGGAGDDLGAPSRGDKFALLAAAVSDAAGQLGGNPGTALASTQKLLLSRAQKAKQQEILGSLYGAPSVSAGAVSAPGEAAAASAGAMPAAAAVSSPRPGLDLRDPAFQAKMLAYRSAGGDPSDIIEFAKANQPEIAFAPDGTPIDKGDRNVLNHGPYANRANVNNTIVNLNDPTNENRVIPSEPVKGAMPVYDNRGQVVDWRLPEGARGAIAGASAADASGKAEFNPTNYTDAQGRPVTTTAGNLARGGPIVGRAPEAATAAGIVATASANAAAGLPAMQQSASEALNAINSLRNHPALGARTGLSGVLPAFPGTPGVSFDATLNQLKGKLFLQAFSALKGGGAVSEIEGKKATDALARLDTKQSEADFKAALGEVESVIRSGLTRAQKQGAGAAGQGGQPAVRTSGAGFRIVGVRDH